MTDGQALGLRRCVDLVDGSHLAGADDPVLIEEEDRGPGGVEEFFDLTAIAALVLRCEAVEGPGRPGRSAQRCGTRRPGGPARTPGAARRTGPWRVRGGEHAHHRERAAVQAVTGCGDPTRCRARSALHRRRRRTGHRQTRAWTRGRSDTASCGRSSSSGCAERAPGPCQAFSLSIRVPRSFAHSSAHAFSSSIC